MSKEHIKELRKSIKDNLFSIRLLTSEIDDLKDELELEIKKTDLQILNENWYLLLDYYTKKHPLIYSEIAIECLSLLQSRQRYGGGERTIFYLDDICNFWLNGGMKKEQPIVSVIYVRYSITEKHYLYKLINSNEEFKDISVKDLIPLLINCKKVDKSKSKTLSEWFPLIQHKYNELKLKG